jgi:hypothetical protein
MSEEHFGEIGLLGIRKKYQDEQIPAITLKIDFFNLISFVPE